MEKCNIDLNTLTLEAEAGHGHFMRSVLGSIPFEEQIHIANQIAKLSKEQKNSGYPVIEFCVKEGSEDACSGYGYSTIQIYRRIPNKRLGSLFDKRDLMYESSLNLTTGEKTVAYRDL